LKKKQVVFEEAFCAAFALRGAAHVFAARFAKSMPPAQPGFQGDRWELCAYFVNDSAPRWNRRNAHP